jgi:hypothetical protein
MDIKKYWRDVHAMAASLPHKQIYFLVSLDNPDKDITGGRVVDVNNATQAAELIVGRTHKLASEDDIDRFKADEKRNADELAAIEFKRKGQLAMPQELQDLVRMATRAVDPASPEKKKKEQ